MLVTAFTCFAENNTRDGFVMINAADFDGKNIVSNTGSFSANQDTGVVGGIFTGSSLWYTLDFDVAPQSLDFYAGVSQNYAGGVVEVRADDPDKGVLLAKINIEATDWSNAHKHSVDMLEKVTGVHKVYFTIRAVTCNIYKFQFRKPGANDSGYAELLTDYSYSDTNDNEFARDIEMVTQLGVMGEYKNGRFEPQIPLKRGEFAEIMADLLELEKSSGKRFNDVPAEHKNSGAINAMCDVGYFAGNGDGNFEPDSYMLWVDAYVVALKILGFGVVAEQNGGYPKGYELTIYATGMKSCLKNDEKFIRRDAMANYICELIEADGLEGVLYAKDNVTYKRGMGYFQKKNVFKGRGFVEANSFTGLYNPESHTDYGQIIIDNVLYSTGSTAASAYIGLDCEFYYKADDGKRELLAVLPSNGIRLYTYNIIDDEIVKFNSTVIEIADEKLKVRIHNVTPQSVYLYNGKAIEGSVKDNIDTSNFKGQIRIAQNSNGRITVIIEEYSNIIVSSKDSFSETITDKISGKRFSVNSSRDDVVITKEGKYISVQDINAGDLLVVYESKNVQGKKLIRFDVQNGAVSGKITKSGNNCVYIGDKKYYPARELTGALIVGKVIEAKCNKYNELVEIKMSDGDIYRNIGCLMSTGCNQNKDYFEVKILTADSGTVIFKSAGRIRIDGKKYSDANSAFNEIKTVDLKTPIYYELNENEEITLIDTYKNGDGVNRIFRLTEDGRTDRYSARERSRIFYDNRTGMGRYTIADDAKAVYFWNRDTDNNLAEISEPVYNEYYSPDCDLYSFEENSDVVNIIVYHDYEVRGTYTPIVVREVYNSYDVESGEFSLRLEGFSGSTKREWGISDIIYSGNDSFKRLVDSLTLGDFIKCEFDSHGDISAAELVFLHDGAGSTENGINSVLSKDGNWSNGSASQEKRQFMGVVSDINGEFVKLGSKDGNIDYLNANGAPVVKIVCGNREEIYGGLSVQDISVGDHIVVWVRNDRVVQIVAYERVE